MYIPIIGGFLAVFFGLDGGGRWIVGWSSGSEKPGDEGQRCPVLCFRPWPRNEVFSCWRCNAFLMASTCMPPLRYTKGLTVLAHYLFDKIK